MCTSSHLPKYWALPTGAQQKLQSNVVSMILENTMYFGKYQNPKFKELKLAILTKVKVKRRNDTADLFYDVVLKS